MPFLKSNQQTAMSNGGFNMPFVREDTQGNTRLKIRGALSIYEAAELRQELLARLEDNTDLELDLEGVTECDTAGLQLLWAARKTAGESLLL